MTVTLELLESSAVFRGSELEGNGINETIGDRQVVLLSPRASAIAVFRQTDEAF